jgi:uncharacterized protein
MADQPPEDLIGYGQLVEQALRGVVREALRRVAKSGLPGDHHFYITCRTRDPGVQLPPYLREQYPQEITLVLQHQFWDLAVEDERFGITLSFGGRNERIVVPFSAVTAFADPSIDFGLQFKTLTAAETEAAAVAQAADAKKEESASQPDSDEPKVVKLDTFRRH